MYCFMEILMICFQKSLHQTVLHVLGRWSMITILFIPIAIWLFFFPKLMFNGSVSKKTYSSRCYSSRKPDQGNSTCWDGRTSNKTFWANFVYLLCFKNMFLTSELIINSKFFWLALFIFYTLKPVGFRIAKIPNASNFLSAVLLKIRKVNSSLKVRNGKFQMLNRASEVRYFRINKEFK